MVWCGLFSWEVSSRDLCIFDEWLEGLYGTPTPLEGKWAIVNYWSKVDIVLVYVKQEQPESIGPQPFMLSSFEHSTFPDGFKNSLKWKGKETWNKKSMEMWLYGLCEWNSCNLNGNKIMQLNWRADVKFQYAWGLDVWIYMLDLEGNILME